MLVGVTQHKVKNQWTLFLHKREIMRYSEEVILEERAIHPHHGIHVFMI